jgi:VIT1/CCC1 family predicted Fe2+/Mn2+ transporter
MAMNEGVKAGLHFGLTSGVITTLGLIVGLHSGTGSLRAVVGGILIIAVADAMSDALGIHISKEAERASTQQVWMATATTFGTKFATAATFIIPILFLPLTQAIIASIVWGLLVLTLLSYLMARNQGTQPLHVIGEHLAIALVVVVSTHFLGDWIARIFETS